WVAASVLPTLLSHSWARCRAASGVGACKLPKDRTSPGAFGSAAGRPLTRSKAATGAANQRDHLTFVSPCTSGEVERNRATHPGDRTHGRGRCASANGRRTREPGNPPSGGRRDSRTDRQRPASEKAPDAA